MERVNDIAFQDCQILMCDSRASLGEVDYKAPQTRHWTSPVSLLPALNSLTTKSQTICFCL